MSTAGSEARWRSEATFFDQQAEKAATRLSPLDPRTVRRYRKLRPAFAPEFRFGVLGDLRGRHVLDVGCGEGPNSVLLALLGARVTGIDLSPGAPEVARRRAALDGVANACTFVCSPIETAPFVDGSFDVVFCDAILHHLLDDLDAVMQKLVRWVRPGGTFVCVEPLSSSGWLRRLRTLVPIKTAHTPGERPLEARDCAIIQRHLPDLRLRHFRLLGRLERVVLPGQNYECAPAVQRAAMWMLAAADRALLALPPLQAFSSVAVMWGSPPSAA